MNTLSKLIYISRAKKQIIILINDIVFSFFSTFLAFSLRLDKIFIPQGIDWVIFLLAGTIFIPFFIPFGLYQAIFRYSGPKSLLNIFYAIICYGFVFFIILFVSKIHGIPRSIGILQPLLFFVCVSSSRIFLVSIIQEILRPTLRKNTLIYGAGESGVESSSQLHDYNIIAFLDDDKRKWGKKINTIPIINPIDIGKYIIQKKVTNVLIAIPSLTILRRRELVSEISKFSVAVKILPRINDLASGKVNIADFKKVQIGDLLDRKITWEDKLISQDILKKNILVTGAGGSIGSELCRQIVFKKPSKIILLDNSEYNLYAIINEIENLIIINNFSITIIPLLCSVRDKTRIENIFNIHQPDFVYHAAAYKHVPMIESNILESISNNVFGTLNVIKSAAKNNCKKFVLISTDKAVRPTNFMGASKRLAEMCVQAYSNNLSKNNNKIIMSMVRFGNVLGSTGSVVPLFNNQIESGGPITVTDKNVTRYFMTIPEAVGLVLQTAIIAKGGEVFVLNMGEQVNIYDLAKKMIRLSGLSEKNDSNPNGDIEIKLTGLRPGEKMYEELLIGDNPVKTKYPDIMMEKENYLDWDLLEEILNNLKNALKINDENQVVNILQNKIDGFNIK